MEQTPDQKKAQGFKDLHDLEQKGKSGRITFHVNKGKITEVEAVSKY